MTVLDYCGITKKNMEMYWCQRHTRPQMAFHLAPGSPSSVPLKQLRNYMQNVLHCCMSLILLGVFVHVKYECCHSRRINLSRLELQDLKKEDLLYPCTAVNNFRTPSLCLFAATLGKWDAQPFMCK